MYFHGGGKADARKPVQRPSIRAHEGHEDRPHRNDPVPPAPGKAHPHICRAAGRPRGASRSNDEARGLQPSLRRFRDEKAVFVADAAKRRIHKKTCPAAAAGVNKGFHQPYGLCGAEKLAVVALFPPYAEFGQHVENEGGGAAPQQAIREAGLIAHVPFGSYIPIGNVSLAASRKPHLAPGDGAVIDERAGKAPPARRERAHEPRSSRADDEGVKPHCSERVLSLRNSARNAWGGLPCSFSLRARAMRSRSSAASSSP